MRDYRDLLVWRKAMDLAETTYGFTRTLPPEERFGLRSQMQRGVVSVASNIAEGAARKSDREFARFLRMAYGSLSEVETQALLCKRVGIGDPEQANSLLAAAEELRRMLSGLIGTVLSSSAP